MSSLLRDRLGTHILVADGAMGTMLQMHEPTDADFEGNLGCNEILNVTRPDVIADVHAKYLAAGADLIETNTFGANLTALTEYDSAHRIAELAGAGARIARQVADEYSSANHPRFVLGSVGPGVRLPSLGQVTFAELREGYETQIAAMIEAGIDAVQIETCQDLLQVKAAVIGARRAMTRLGADVPVFVTITVEMTGTMLLGTEVGAALATLRALKVDAIGLNCATGPEQMREHLRVLSTESDLPLACLPNAGLPELTPEGPRYPLAPEALAAALNAYREEFGLAIVGGCCGTTPEHIKVLADAVRDQAVPARPAPEGSSVASLYQAVSLKQDTAFLNVGERTNANGSLAFRKAMLAQQWQ
ncbi:MAG: methionine synthase, partial [Propionibacterium sp.]